MWPPTQIRFLAPARGRLLESLVGRYLLDVGPERPLRDTLALSSFQDLPVDFDIQMYLLATVYRGIGILPITLPWIVVSSSTSMVSWAGFDGCNTRRLPCLARRLTVTSPWWRATTISPGVD